MLRVPEIEAEGSSINILSRAASKKLPQSFLDNTYVRDVGNAFYEVFMRIDLPTLRGIDSDSEKRQTFIDSRLPPNVAAANAVNGKFIPVIFLVQSPIGNLNRLDQHLLWLLSLSFY